MSQMNVFHITLPNRGEFFKKSVSLNFSIESTSSFGKATYWETLTLISMKGVEAFDKQLIMKRDGNNRIVGCETESCMFEPEGSKEILINNGEYGEISL